MIDQQTLSQAIIEWQSAGHGNKSQIIRRYAQMLGKDYSTVYRAVSRTHLRTSKLRSDKGKRMNPEINDHTRTIWMIKQRGPEEAGVLATDQAVDIALREGLIPPEAAKIPPATYNRIARFLKLNRDGGRWTRFQAKYPNLVHQIDASSSKFFYVHRRLPDGERILKLHRPAAHYKNKPVPIRERPWLYGVVDDHSGYQLCRYTTAEGESAADGILFLQYAWGQKENPRIPFRGLPKLIYMDNGSLAKAAPIKDFLARLNITVIPRTPYAKQAGGKIERPWRTLWGRFERTFMALDNWHKFEITLTELNRQMVNFLIEQNSRPHRQQKEISREQAWLTINLRGGVVDIPPQALSTIFQRYQRTVKGGYFSLNNQDYQVTELTEGKVWVYEGVFNDRLVVEDMQTRQKYEVKLFEPLSFGQRIEVIQTEAQKLAESAEQLSITQTHYDQAPQSNVVNLPVRTCGEKELVDPLTVPGVKNQPEEQERLFNNSGERYEWLFQRQCAGVEPLQGDELGQADIKFMRDYETTPAYKQSVGTYARRKKFWQTRGKVANAT